MVSRSPLSHAEVVREFFRRGDAGEFAGELFAPEFAFYFPKYGVGRGHAAFTGMVGGLMASMPRLAHRIDDLLFIEQGDRLAVEGTTEGHDAKGVPWRGGETPGGRFCSIFEFDAQGRISRMNVYLDPDYTSEDQARFLWPHAPRQGW